MVEEKVVGAKYVLIEDAWMGKKGDLFTLIKDDGTVYPKFSDATGKSVCINIERVVKLNEQPAHVTATISKEQFDSIKAGDKLVVRSDLTEDTDVPYGITADMAETEFDCPELIYGKIYTDDDGWTFRYCKTKYTHENAKVTGSPYLSADGGFVNQSDSYIHFYKWRKATTAEVAKLVAAEKENGYVPPLVNKVGTEI